MKKSYLIFGEQPIKTYHNEGIEALIEEIHSDKSFDGAIHEYDPEKQTGIQLLDDYDGWNGYAEITAVEYRMLEEKLKEVGDII